LIPLKVGPLDNVVDVDVVFLIGFGVRDYTPAILRSKKLNSPLHIAFSMEKERAPNNAAPQTKQFDETTGWRPAPCGA
jgi:hypothetical protein